ncbi:MAG: Riboflavin kinase [Devosia sp.]|nr:Riboflavin kinase [Devosia sp.]
MISGSVVHGEKRGRALGFPTANIALASGNPFPPEGVYCCLVRFSHRDTLYGATVSVGTNPTFPDIASIRVEAHIHDLDELLYGLGAELRLLRRLRDMRRFASVEALIAQMESDVQQSRQRHSRRNGAQGRAAARDGVGSME